MVKPDRFLTREERERIRAAIAEAELKTAGEIRVLVAGRSAPWSWFFGSLVGVLVGAGVLWLQHAASWGHPGLVEILTAVAAVLGVTLLAAWLIPPFKAARDRAVWNRAKREFERLGIGATAGATGVLIMISLHERETVVLADRAINEKVSPETWPHEVKVILEGIKSGRAADGIVQAVGDVGALLAKHFPRRDDDRNELSDEVVVR